jgi:hypothetical protein
MPNLKMLSHARNCRAWVHLTDGEATPVARAALCLGR